MSVELRKARVVLERWRGNTRYVVACPNQPCYPQNVHWSFAGLAFECFSSTCPMAAGVPEDQETNRDA